MFRLTQIIRNLFIRLEAYLSVFFSFVKKILSFFANLFGLSQSNYFVESGETQSINQTPDQQQIEIKQDIIPETSTTQRRRPAKMDYYLDMARDVKKPK